MNPGLHDRAVGERVIQLVLRIAALAASVQEQHHWPLTAGFGVEPCGHVEEVVALLATVGGLEGPAQQLGLAASVDVSLGERRYAG